MHHWNWDSVLLNEFDAPTLRKKPCPHQTSPSRNSPQFLKLASPIFLSRTLLKRPILRDKDGGGAPRRSTWSSGSPRENHLAREASRGMLPTILREPRINTFRPPKACSGSQKLSEQIPRSSQPLPPKRSAIHAVVASNHPTIHSLGNDHLAHERKEVTIRITCSNPVALIR